MYSKSSCYEPAAVWDVDLVLLDLYPQLVLRSHKAQRAVVLRVKRLVLPPVSWVANSVVPQTLQLRFLLCNMLIHTL